MPLAEWEEKLQSMRFKLKAFFDLQI